MKAQEGQRLQYQFKVFIPAKRMRVHNVPEKAVGKVKGVFMKITG